MGARQLSTSMTPAGYPCCISCTNDAPATAASLSELCWSSLWLPSSYIFLVVAAVFVVDVFVIGFNITTVTASIYDIIRSNICYILHKWLIVITPIHIIINKSCCLMTVLLQQHFISEMSKAGLSSVCLHKKSMFASVTKNLKEKHNWPLLFAVILCA